MTDKINRESLCFVCEDGDLIVTSIIPSNFQVNVECLNCGAIGFILEGQPYLNDISKDYP